MFIISIMYIIIMLEFVLIISIIIIISSSSSSSIIITCIIMFSIISMISSRAFSPRQLFCGVRLARGGPLLPNCRTGGAVTVGFAQGRVISCLSGLPGLPFIHAHVHPLLTFRSKEIRPLADLAPKAPPIYGVSPPRRLGEGHPLRGLTAKIEAVHYYYCYDYCVYHHYDYRYYYHQY